jgi:ferredoxin-type protein NapH
MTAGLILAGILAILIWIKNQTRNVSYLRLFIQIFSVPLIFLGLIVGPFGLPQFPSVGNAPRDLLVGAEVFGTQFPDGLSVPVLACFYPSGRTVTCPIWQIQGYIFPFWNTGLGFGWGVFYTTSGLERLAIVLGFVTVMALVLGRFFCGWICPFGLYMDLLDRIRKIFKRRYLKLSNRANTGLRQLRYVIIAAFLILSFVFGSQEIFGSQIVSATERGGYVFSYLSAPFCQVCPMRPLCVLTQMGLGSMNSTFVFSSVKGVLFEVGYYVSSLNLIIFGLVTVAALAYRRIWCRICPLGGLTALFNRFVPFKWASVIRLNKVEEKCTKCGICKRVCPPQITEVYEEKGGDVTTSACILCLRCVEMCPYEDCLKVNVVGKTVFKSRNWLKQLK